MRVLLDTSVLVAALRSPSGLSSRLLQAALQRKILPLVSTPLFLEYEAVLARAEHLAASGLSSQQVHLLLDTLADVIEPVRFTFRWRPAALDPGDDMVLETAVNGNADALVTFNIRDFSAAESFGVKVLSKAGLGNNGNVMRNETLSFQVSPFLLAEARQVAEHEGVELDQLLQSALAEKVNALRPERFFRERARNADLPGALEILRDTKRGQVPGLEDTLGTHP